MLVDFSVKAQALGTNKTNVEDLEVFSTTCMKLT